MGQGSSQPADDGGAEAERAQLEAKTADADKAGTKLQLQEGESFELAKDRACTDILCLVIFALFWVMMFAIAGSPARTKRICCSVLALIHLLDLCFTGFGIAMGQPDRLVSGYDFNGNVCGSGQMADRPFVYYPFPFPQDATR